MAKQTTYQNKETIREGSVRVLIGDDFQNLTDIGALRDPQFESLQENQEIEFDNVDRLRKFVKGDRAMISFDLAEINFENLAELDDGLVNLTTNDGSTVTGAQQQVAAGDWNYNDFIKLENQNGDGSQPTVNSVTAGSDGSLTEETDLYVVTDEDGDWGIMVVDSTNLSTEDQTLTIDYDYTPAASKTLTFNEDGSRNEKVMRIINENAAGEEFRIDLINGTNFTPVSIDYAADNEDDVAILPIEFQADVKEMVDEQNTAQ